MISIIAMVVIAKLVVAKLVIAMLVIWFIMVITLASLMAKLESVIIIFVHGCLVTGIAFDWISSYFEVTTCTLSVIIVEIVKFMYSHDAIEDSLEWKAMHKNWID